MQITNKEKTNKTDLFLFKYSRVPLTEKLFFTQYLGIMLKAGISLSGALSALSKQTPNRYLAYIIRDIKDEVEKGESFSKGLKKHEKVFGELYVNMIESGEASGRLEEILNYLYLHMKKSHELVSKARGALIYPAVIMAVMVAVVLFLLIFVMPKLTELLKSFGTALPLATRILISVSDAIVNHGFALVVLALLIFGIFSFIYRNKKGKFLIHGFLLKIPVYSKVAKKINLARFARTLSSLLKTDIMIVKTFEMTANSLGNLQYRQAVLEMGEKIKKGKQINQVLSAYPNLFTPVTVQIVSVGEETGQLDQMLGELADFYESEVDETLRNLPSLIEPVLILALGICVGIVALAIMMPIYAMTMTLSI